MTTTSKGSRVGPGTCLNRWTVVRLHAPTRPDGPSRVLCRCVCGHEETITVDDFAGDDRTGCETRRCRDVWALASSAMPSLGIEGARDLGRTLYAAGVDIRAIVRSTMRQLERRVPTRSARRTSPPGRSSA